MLLDDGDHSYIYGPSSTPIAQIDASGEVEYLHTDLLGSVRLITDDDGDPAGTSTFDEFGNRVNHTGPSDSAFGFTGAWTDADTELVHLRARDYDPATGQFLTVDPIVDQTRQPYAYTGNNPLTRTDPTGLYFIYGAGDQGALKRALDQFVNNVGGFFVGIGDGAIFWGTESMRETFSPGSTCYVDKNGFYYVGVGLGIAIITYLSAGSMDIILGGNRLSQNAQRAEAQAALAATNAARIAAPTRVTLRAQTKAEIRASARTNANGDFIDPNTGAVIPKNGPFDYGHKPGLEWWRTKQLALKEGWSRQQIIDYENNPNHYQIEDPSSNRSHLFEAPR